MQVATTSQKSINFNNTLQADKAKNTDTNQKQTISSSQNLIITSPPLQSYQIPVAVNQNVAQSVEPKLIYQLTGYDRSTLEIALRPGESVKAEQSAFVFKDKGVKMTTKMDGGFFKGLVRKFSDEDFFFAVFTNTSDTVKKVGFHAPQIGTFLPIDLGQLGGKLICQKGAFVCGSKDISVSSTFTKNLGAGLFGGEGFILQELKGDGLVFINAQGSITTRTLDPNETMEVATGKIVGFTPDVKYSVGTTGGIKNIFLSGEGLFNATLQGPGTVFVQSVAASTSAPQHYHNHHGASSFMGSSFWG
ncbi:MAG: TIGR00266 family protein [Candidatus Margulisiibacteriota bacterium]|jgi:uncharacterized protein (TIGR00266 family)